MGRGSSADALLVRKDGNDEEQILKVACDLAHNDRLIAEGLIPQNRWGTAEDVARAVSAFGRGDLDYSTGIAIDVSGGFQLRRL